MRSKSDTEELNLVSEDLREEILESAKAFIDNYLAKGDAEKAHEESRKELVELLPRGSSILVKAKHKEKTNQYAVTHDTRESLKDTAIEKITKHLREKGTLRKASALRRHWDLSKLKAMAKHDKALTKMLKLVDETETLTVTRIEE